MKDMSIGAHELILFANNDPELSQQRMNVARALAVKKARKLYNHNLALKAWLRFAYDAAIAYTKIHGAKGDSSYKLFPTEDRRGFARYYLKWFTAEHKLGNFKTLLPPKYQAASTRKATSDILNGRTPAKKKRRKKKASKKKASSAAQKRLAALRKRLR